MGNKYNETNQMIRMKRNIIFTFIVLLLISCNNQNKISETKQSQKDTIKNQVNNKKEEVWTIERLNKEYPYYFDTLLKNGNNLHFERINKSEVINDIECQLTLVKGKNIIDTLNIMGSAPVMKNLGYIGADFNEYFVFLQSFGFGNPHEMQLLRKEDAAKIVSGFIVDADEKNELLLYCKGYDSLMLYDVNRKTDKLLVNLNNCNYITCMVSQLNENLKIKKVTNKQIELEILQDENKTIRKKYYR